MKKIDKKNLAIYKTTNKTKKAIKKLKNQKPSAKDGLLAWLLNPIYAIGMVVVGGLIIIGLIRYAAAKWAKQYMP